jgi:DNA-binding response OmpR family regulator
MMTAKSGDCEQIKSFGNGADDYIKKPFLLILLKARIESILKRTGNNIKDEIVAGKIRLDCAARKVFLEDEFIVTTPKEFDVLCYMIKNQNVTLNREQILNAVWGQDYDGTYRTVDTIIKQIRIKLGDCQTYIKSIYGVGYIFEV